MSVPGRPGRIALWSWLACIALALLVIARAQFTADMSAFLPAAPTAEQRLLVEQLKDGAAARLILVAIEGGDAAQRAAASRALAGRLRADARFAAVANGEPVGLERERELLFTHRYLLSPRVDAPRFTPDGLRAAIADTLDMLASPAGLMVKSLVPRDPTGEMMELFTRLQAGAQPKSADGIWVSRDGARALLLAHTRAAGGDIDAQQRAIEAIRAAFAATVRHGGPGADLRVMVAGPGVFSVSAREAIRSEVTRLSALGAAVVVTLLLLLYRSAVALTLGLLPVASGVLAGIAAVALGFGTVHGLTLGFGTTLIGEAVDYSIYLFVQSASGGAARRDDWLAQFWPTIRLGVTTSIAGFAALVFSGFPGLAQLGVFSIAGLVAAATVTRFVLPQLMPAGFRVRDVSAFGARLASLVQRAQGLRWAVLALVAAACVALAAQRSTLWNTELAALSPVPLADQQLDAALRADLGAPDVRHLVAIEAPDADTALARAEALAPALDALMTDGVIAGYQSPADYLPSRATQQARIAALPAVDTLRANLAAALDGLPLRADKLAPFLADVEAARRASPLTPADLAGSSLGLGLEALLAKQADRWVALLPLRAPAEGASIDARRVRSAVAAANIPGALAIDLKAESDALYAGYLREAIVLSALGCAAIVALLALALRDAARVLRVVAPLAAAILLVAAGLALAGERMTLLHLVGMLLTVAVGSNYALFFAGNTAPEALPRTLASLAFANLTTVAAFGLLAFSHIPVLHAIGITVGPGAVLALLISAVFSKRLGG